MPTGRPKKMLNMYIYEILKKYTDEEHRISQKEILDKLEKDFEMKVDRKAVKSNILDLIEAGYPIEYEIIKRNSPGSKAGEENEIYTNLYIERDFTDAEIRLLVDSVLFSKSVPSKDRNILIDKLENLSNIHYKSKVKHINSLATDTRETNKLFYTIDILDEAISKGRQVKFHYDNYGMDKKLHHRLNADGKPKEYIINPYTIVAANGRYYLVCNLDKYDNLSNYRLDRISDIQVLETAVKDKSKVKELQNGLDTAKHISEHIYMFAGESVRVTFEAQNYIISDILDYFGSDVKFRKKDKKTVIATVTVNRQDMRLWAMQYALQVKVTAPTDLAEECKQDLYDAIKKYENQEM